MSTPEAASTEEDHSLSRLARAETLAIPQAVRDAVDERDGRYCRVCGRYLGEERALHHVEFGGDARGMGGRRVHNVDEIVTVCWMWANSCHDRVHRQKLLYQPLLRDVVKRPGVTALQILRWRAARIRRRRT